jgi:phosphate-selective porin OprO/OprP
MLKRYWQLAGVTGTMAILAAGQAGAQSSSVSSREVRELHEEIQALQQKVRQLEGKVAAPERQAPSRSAPPLLVKASAPAPTAIVKMSPNNRPSICTPDEQNCIALTSRMHVDVGGYRYRPDSAATVPQRLDSGVNVRRARIGILGTFMRDWNYNLSFEFGGSSDGIGGLAPGSLPGGVTTGIHDAQLGYTGLKPFTIEGGFATLPYTLDWATSSNDTMFMERASVTTIAANSLGAGSFRSHVGIRGNTDRLWAGVYLTGPTLGAVHIGSSTATVPGTTEQYGSFGRVTYQLLQGEDYSLHVGGDAQAVFKSPTNTTTGIASLTLSDRPELRIDPTTILTTGAIVNAFAAQVYSGEAAAGDGPLFFQGEYLHFNIDRAFGLPTLQFNGWYAQASWTLTGESRVYNPSTGSYGTIIPTHPFAATGHYWGAWELAARYSVTDLNDRLGFKTGIAGGDQVVYTLGLNWYVNRNVRLMFNYLHGTIDKQLSSVLATNAGAKFDAAAMRAQVSF